MSPLKATVLINDCECVLSISVGKTHSGPSRHLNIYLGDEETCKPILIGQYVATALVNRYGLVRCFDSELVCVGQCATLAACQVAALADYVSWANIQVVPETE